MDSSFINATSFIPNYNHSNNSFNHNDSSSNTFTNSTSSSGPDEDIVCWRYSGTASVFTITLISIWGVLTPLAVYCLYSQVRSDHVVPVFIINLLISDIIQICCMIVEVAGLNYHYKTYVVIYYGYNCGLTASVLFMTFIATERYLLIAWPFWYRFQRKLKVSASVSVVTWILSVFIGLCNQLWFGVQLGILLIIPVPLLIFFFVRSFKALSTSHNVPPDERRQIIAVLTAVLFAYILTFLPQILTEFVLWGWWWWDINFTTYYNLLNVSCILIAINPLTDLLLYILIKKWVLDKLLVFLCCCRKTNNGNQQTNSITCSWSASQGQTEAENNI